MSIEEHRPIVYSGFHVIPPTSAPTLSFSTTGGLLSTGSYVYSVSFVTSIGETNIGTTVSGSAASNTSSCTLTNIPVSGDVQVVARNIYRTAVGTTTPFKLVSVITDNSSTTYVDTTADASLGANSVVLSTSDQTIGVYGSSYFNGLVKCETNSATASTFTNITCNGNFIKLTYTSVTNAAGTSATSIVTNNYVSSNSLITATIQSMGGVLLTDGIPQLFISAITNGSFTLKILNSGANALSGTYIIYCSVIN